MATADIFESDAPELLHGRRATESAHRKIELQSPADLTYLIANVSHAAREKLDQHLPPEAAQSELQQGKGDDKLRLRVEELVDQVGIIQYY